MNFTETDNVITQVLSNTLAQVSLTILAIIILQLIAHSTIDKIIRRAVRSHKYRNHLDEEKREETLANIFRTATTVTLYIIGSIVILWQLHVNISALLTGAGLVGVVVGLGAQSTIKDYLAGIFIILENQYRVQDIITLRADGQDVSGYVEEITIRITKLRDLDGKLHIVRNGLSTVITNMTFQYANVNLNVGVAYEADIDKIEEVMNQVGKELEKDKEWKERIIEPIQFFRVEDFGDSSITIKALGKVEPAMQWDVASEYRRRLKKAFDKSGINIPFPQIVVHKAEN